MTMTRMGKGLRIGIVFCLFTWQYASTASASIDLTVESIQIQPDRPHVGYPVTVTAVVRNSGSYTVEGFEISVSIRQGKEPIRSISRIPVLSVLPRMGSGKSVPVEI